MTMEKKEMYTTLDSLWLKYEGNEYMQNKIHHYITRLLETNLEQVHEEFKQREERKSKLMMEQEKFMEEFLGRNKYFYCPSTEFFFSYDGEHYKICNGDDIVHEILSTISKQKALMPWKHKIKNSIIRLIKERNLQFSIPESITIQKVLQTLYPFYFATKNNAKYFLTIIGDNLLKKNENLIYFVPSHLKPILKAISDQAFTLFGNGNITNNMKYKYHEHHYKECRLLRCQKTTNLQVLTAISQNMLDILCVSIHYSERYQSADMFLKHDCESEIVDHALFLTNNEPEQLVKEFIQSALQESKVSSIDMKNMLFLWKQYLEQRNIPQVIFINKLKLLLKEQISFNEANQCFLEITSRHLPNVKSFLEFWEQNITYEVEELEFEIGEIVSLFKLWAKNPHMNIHEDLLLEYIRHFYPEIYIEDNKYILNISCKLWNKSMRIREILNQYKLHCIQKHKEYTTLKVYDAYSYYCKNEKPRALIASKKCFEKYFTDFLTNQIL